MAARGGGAGAGGARRQGLGLRRAVAGLCRGGGVGMVVYWCAGRRVRRPTGDREGGRRAADGEGSMPADGGGSLAGGKLGAGVGDGRHAGRRGIGGGALGGGG